MRKVVHHPREFVISRAAAYHSGFNSGFNVAEAVNFALPSWIAIAEKAKHCVCSKDSVQINMTAFKQVLAGEDVEIAPLPKQAIKVTKRRSQKKLSALLSKKIKPLFKIERVSPPK